MIVTNQKALSPKPPQQYNPLIFLSNKITYNLIQLNQIGNRIISQQNNQSSTTNHQMRKYNMIAVYVSVLFLSLIQISQQWCLRTLFSGRDSIESIDFTNDGEFILTGEKSGRVVLWKKDTLEILRIYNFGSVLWEARLTSSEGHVVIAGENNNIDIINYADFSFNKTINTNLGNKVFDIDTFTISNNDTILACGANKKFRIFNLTTGNLVDQQTVPDTPYSCQYGGAKKWVVVAGANFVQSYQFSYFSGNSTSTITSNYTQLSTGNTYYEGCIRSSTNYSIAVSTGGEILQSQLDTSSTDQTISGSAGSLYTCAYSPDTTYFSVAGGNGKVYLFNATSRANSLQAILLANSSSTFKSSRFSPDSNTLLLGNQNGTIFVYQRFCLGCPVGSYPNQTQCVLCAKSLVGCSICLNSTVCKSCMFGYYMPSGQSACKSCAVIEGCGNCNSSSNCTLCLGGYYKTGLTCTRCLTTQYGCVQCSGPGPSQCLECDKNSYLNGGDCVKCTTLSYCIYCNSSSFCLQCIAGFYQNAGVCTLCQSTVNPNCLQCQSATNCTICVDGYRLNSSRLCQQCSPQCIFCNSTDHCFDCIQQMYVSSSFTCLFCVHPCQTCLNQTYCLSCVQSYYLSTVGTCSNCPSPCLSCNSSTRCQSCIVGFYLDTGTNLCVKCSIVQPNCRQCTSTLCLACQAQFILNTGVCQNCSYLLANCQICSNSSICQHCMKGYYPTGLTGVDSCKLCPLNCSSCISTTNCSACVPGFYLTSFKCKLCAKNCVTCKSSSTSSCYSCIQGFYLSASIMGSCLNCSIIDKCISCHNASYCLGCRTGFFLTSPTVCTGCSLPCATCNTSVTDCLTCHLGYYFSMAGGVGTCVACNYGCSQCQNSSSICLNCIASYFYDTYTCLQCKNYLSNCSQCLNSTYCIVCQTGYYPILGVCQSCSIPIAKCLKCNVLGSTCSICEYGYLLSSTNTSCTLCNSYILYCQQCTSTTSCETCIGGFYQNGGSCISCSSGCLTCFNSTICEVCFDKYIMLTNKTCFLCEDAIQGCELCSSITVCTSCLLGYYRNGSVCTACDSVLEGCESCLDSNTCQQCSIYYQLQTNNTCSICSSLYSQCQICGNTTQKCIQCERGYYVDAAGTCSLCNPAVSYGCLKCTSNSTCIQCMSGYLLNTTSNSCQKCQSQFSNCIYCNYTVCFQCQSGYYLSSGVCNLCSGQGCEICLDSNPSLCVTCNTRYYKSGSSCILCSLSLPQCLQCSDIATCVECTSGYYLTMLNKCSLCSSLYPGCSICSPSGCIDCQANFYLNQTDNQCHNCTDHIPGCAFCVSQSICLSCQNGYYVVNQTCEKCANITGCLYCINSTNCAECQQSYFLAANDSDCYLCVNSIPGCYACTDNATCISCIGNYKLVGGICQQARPEVLASTVKIQLKSFYLNKTCLKHILYAVDFRFMEISQDWSSNVELTLIDGQFKQILLVILYAQFANSGKQLIFYTDNPISDRLDQSVTDMPFIKQTSRLLVQASADLNFHLKMMMSETTTQQIMPNINQVGDLYLTFPYLGSTFYQSFIRNRSYYHFIFGLIITAVILGWFFWKTCFQFFGKTDRGAIIPHIFAIKCASLILYPTFAEYVNYCYGFMTIDFPWFNFYLGQKLGNIADDSPQPFKMYYINLSLCSTYFISTFVIIFVWLTMNTYSYLRNSLEHTKKVQQIKSLIYNIFILGATIAGCLSLQGIILNSVYGANTNTIFYIVGIVIYLGIFVQIVYSWFISRQYVTKYLQFQIIDPLPLTTHTHKLRVFIKSTLLSLSHLSPLYFIIVIMSLEIIFIYINYKLKKDSYIAPKIEIGEYLLINAVLLLMIFYPDALIGLILASICICLVLILQLIRAYHEYQQNQTQKKYQRSQNITNNETKQKISIPVNSSMNSLKQYGQNQNQKYNNNIPIVPLIRSRNKIRNRNKNEVLFSIHEIRNQGQ